MALTTGPSLVFHTRRLSLPPAGTTEQSGHNADLARFAGADGVLFDHPSTGFAGRGIAATIPVEDRSPRAISNAVASVLQQVQPFAVATQSPEPVVAEGLGPTIFGPVAFGALPFAGDEPCELIVPREIVRRDANGDFWHTTIGTAADLGSTHWAPSARATDAVAALTAPANPPAAAQERSTLVVAPARPAASWLASIAALRDELRRGTTRKAVLARALHITSSTPIDLAPVVNRLRLTYPNCYRYVMPIGNLTFIGASPELLVRRDGDAVHAQPMAGTTRRTGDPVTDAALAEELMGSLKDQIEHRITIDMVHETLLPWCSYLDEEAEPSIVAMANVAHLATRLEGRLSHPPASVLELVSALHPTPAVGGYPRADALRLIDEHEHLDRGWYAGPVGWVDAEGNGTWAVALRCAEVSADRTEARLFAGVGVVPDSDPAAELAETDAKLAAMLGAFGLP